MHCRSMNRVFAALADPTRRAILAELSRGERAATDLARAAPRRMSQPAISKHLRVLREAGLIRKRVHGRNHWCLLRAEPLAGAAEWLDHYRGFWEGRLDALAAFFESEAARQRNRETGKKQRKKK
jgi:DNA-binding transcriptional ArsR family regulator